MRILLTGPTGQVGSALLKTLSDLGEVVALPRDRLDLARPRIEAIAAARPDVIVNAAAYTAVERAEDEPDAAQIVNAVAPRLLAEEARRLDALLIHFSTDYVFDGEKDAAYSESDAPNPLNTYGRTKLAGEEAVQSSGCRYLILRTSWVYAPTGKNFLNTIREQDRAGKLLRVVADQVGAPTSSLMLARAVPHAIARVSAGGPGGLYHLTAAGKTSWHGFARSALPGRPIEAVLSDAYPTKARRPRNSVLDNAKIQRELGIRMPTWEEGLQEVMGRIQ